MISAPEGQKCITSLESKDEKLSVRNDALEPFRITLGFCRSEVREDGGSKMLCEHLSSAV